MAEDGIPEILAEQRLGHDVPGMRGLYAHASARMRDDLKAALQQRWEDSLRDRAAIHPHSPVPLPDKLLAPYREESPQASQPETPRAIHREEPVPVDREKLISQIPPRQPKGPIQTTRMEPVLRASDLASSHNSKSGAKGTRTPDPLLANNRRGVHLRPFPQVRVPGRPSGSSFIRTGCGTCVRYDRCHFRRQAVGARR